MRNALARSRAVILTGPRQCGKTTLAQTIIHRASPNYFDLENPLDEGRLEHPLDTLSRLDGLVVIDEVQRRPNLFPALRVLLDRSDTPGQYLLCWEALRPRCCAKPANRCWAAPKPSKSADSTWPR